MPLSVRGLSLPEGWLTASTYVVQRDPAFTGTLTQQYQNLVSWANGAGYRLLPASRTNYRVSSWSEVRIWNQFQLDLDASAAESNAHLFGEFECRGTCGNRLQSGELFCHRCTSFQTCQTCGAGGLRILSLDGRSYCGNCVQRCSRSRCTNFVNPQIGGSECTSCNPRFMCRACGRARAESDATVGREVGRDGQSQEHKFCSDCATRYVCTECSIYSAGGVAGRPRRCQNCRDKEIIAREKEHQSWPQEDMPSSGSLVLPSTPNRPIRTVSLEIEFDGNGGTVGRSLYRHGLLEQPTMDRYSRQGNGDGRAPALLKSDASVSGGELVVYMLDLDKENHAAALQRVTEVMRSMEKLSYAEFSDQAGGHVHMDMHGYGLQDCWNLYTLFRFLEDPLYRIAGSGALGQHRQLSGNSYGTPPARGPFGSLQQFAVQGFRSGRAGIHFENYFGSASACRCGAVSIGKHEECTCNLGKATVEWRLWNAEITPVILHAWLAIMQATAAFAQDTVLPENDYPYLPFQATVLSRTSVAHKNLVKERLEWIHRYLPLTSDERKSIVTTAKRGELIELGESYLDSLLTIPGENDQSSKKRPPKNPSNSRKAEFRILKDDELIEVPAGFVDDYDPYYDDDDYDDDPY